MSKASAINYVKVKATKLCVFCKHLYWDYAAGGGGCDTCGWGGEGEAKFICGKGHWRWGEYDDLKDYRKHLLTALTCKQYDESEDK